MRVEACIKVLTHICQAITVISVKQSVVRHPSIGICDVIHTDVTPPLCLAMDMGCDTYGCDPYAYHTTSLSCLSCAPHSWPTLVGLDGEGVGTMGGEGYDSADKSHAIPPTSHIVLRQHVRAVLYCGNT